MSIDQLYQIFKKHPQVCTDSRNIIENSLYFALKGEKFNGNSFALDAIGKGARYAIVDEKEYAVNEKIILVDNVLECLQLLANFHRKQLDIKIIAITGTNGKTTTKELINAVLSAKYNVGATKGNLNNHIGVPLTLLSFDYNTQLGIVEMGANHIGEIDNLCQIAEPNIGLITNIGKAHLEGFGSIEGVIAAKSELYNYIIKSNGTLIYNKDNKLLEKLIGTYSHTNTYGIQSKGNIQGKINNCDPFLNATIQFDDSSQTLKSQLVGAYNLDNILAASAVGRYFDVESELIIRSIENYKPDNNRSQLTRTDKNTLLLDYYNANPTSMKAAIENFSMVNAGKHEKVLILADMFELGKNSDEEHYNILKFIENKGFNNVLLAGSYFYKNNKCFSAFETTDQMIEFIQKQIYKNCFILIKGSRGMKLEKCLPFL